MYEYLLYHIKMSISARGKKLLLTEQDLECNTIYFEIKKKKRKVVCINIKAKEEGNQISIHIIFYI